MHKEMGGHMRVLLLLAVSGWLWSAGSVSTMTAQIQTPGVSAGSATPGSAMGSDVPEAPNPYAGRMGHARQVAADDDRRKKMEADADKLVELATDLKTDVDKQSRDETSVSAYMKADQIEKLAHDLKQRLKN